MDVEKFFRPVLGVTLIAAILFGIKLLGEGNSWLGLFLISLAIGGCAVIHNDHKNKIINKHIETIINDTSRLEKERRLELIQLLSQQGYIVISQDVLFLQMRREKKSFSLLLFIILCLLWIVPGFLYLIWYGVQKQDVRTITLK